MKLLLLLLVVCAAACMVQCGMLSWTCIMWKSIRFTTNTGCALNKMQDAYKKMRNANCPNCDKYFHCLGNYRAVHSCGKNNQTIWLAELISNCTEWGEFSPKKTVDLTANVFGRNGGDCEKEYLCKANCTYDTLTRSCEASTCT